MINPLKRTDVFRCSQEAHRRFGGLVSVHHVLREKKCFPLGCIYFLWHCIRLEKGNRCPHRYTVPGRNCGGCTYYVEEKIHLQPTLLLGPEERDRLFEDMESFDAWFVKASASRQSVAGRIATVKPWFEKAMDSNGSRLSLRGYLLVLKRAFIGIESFDDPLYVRVPRTLMQAHRFTVKMKVEMTGEIREDRGRIVVHHPKHVEIVHRGWGWHWTDDKALVAVRTATLLRDQPETCLACPWGSLADVSDRTGPEEKRYRNLFCLKGVADPNACYVMALRRARTRTAARARG